MDDGLQADHQSCGQHFRLGLLLTFAPRQPHSVPGWSPLQHPGPQTPADTDETIHRLLGWAAGTGKPGQNFVGIYPGLRAGQNGNFNQIL
jgi:hypothetical protein